jgi:hypothetical protein
MTTSPSCLWSCGLYKLGATHVTMVRLVLLSLLRLCCLPQVQP